MPNYYHDDCLLELASNGICAVARLMGFAKAKAKQYKCAISMATPWLRLLAVYRPRSSSTKPPRCRCTTRRWRRSMMAPPPEGEGGRGRGSSVGLNDAFDQAREGSFAKDVLVFKQVLHYYRIPAVKHITCGKNQNDGV